MDWRHEAACREVDPELFFPIGNSGPALLQIDEAKQVCRRCSVMDECLRWAIDSGQDAGVWGGMSEDERRALKRRTIRLRARAHVINRPRVRRTARLHQPARDSSRPGGRRPPRCRRPGRGTIRSRPPSSLTTSVRTICRPRPVVESRSKPSGRPTPLSATVTRSRSARGPR